ncbi:MAG TPA: F0F1 ATP synthase assembly protein I [Sedimenticola sp.]|nr:F0F1 ATP synthase assembly protein I [Sedimenticola sp.]
MHLADRRRAGRIIIAQLLATLVAALLLLAAGRVYALSALAGGTIATLANGWFALRVFAGYRAQRPERLLGRFYGAELQKLLLVAVLFAGVMLWLRPLSAAALFGTFMLVQLVPVLVSQLMDR